MTRINVVPVEELSRQHLIAEYRELPRVFPLALKAYQRGADPTTFPQAYTLGRGHVTFFYDKAFYLYCRFKGLINEMRRRGYNTKFTSVPDVAWLIPAKGWMDYKPTEEALAINRARILERGGTRSE